MKALEKVQATDRAKALEKDRETDREMDRDLDPA